MSEVKTLIKGAIGITAVCVIVSPLFVSQTIFNAAIPAVLQFGGVAFYALCSAVLFTKLIKLAKGL